MAFWAFISLHFGLVGLHFLSFCFFWGQLLGSFPQVAKNGLFAQRPYNGFISAVTGSILQFLAFWAFISLHFGLVGFRFLAFWPRGPSFPGIFAFSGRLGSPPPTSCQKWPVCPTSLQWIYQRQDRLHFAVFCLLGLYFLAFWPCGLSFPCILALWAFISLHFGLVGLHFLAFWPCGPSFPFILAFWAFISFYFGLLGFHFLSFWHFGPSFPFILALWAFISLHFGLVGLHFLAFWPRRLHFLSFWPFRGQLLGSSPQVAKNGPFAQRPYNGCISAVTGSILQFFAFGAFISLHFGLVGLHFLAFWPRGPSFPFILAFSGSASRVLPTNCQKWPVCPTSLQWIYQRRDRRHFAVSSLLALWAFISLHFGLVGLHFLAFWPRGPSFPCILALSAFASFHFGLFGVGFWGPPHKFPKMARLPNVLTMDLSAP